MPPGARSDRLAPARTYLGAAAAGLEGAGPFLLAAAVAAGVFARGPANLAFGLLALWGLVCLFYRPWRSRNGPAPPARWGWAAALFTLACLTAIAAGGEFAAGFKALADLLYMFSALPLAWLVFNRRPGALNWLPPLWGLGLMAAAFITFREGGYSLICLRAKASLGIIETGSILGQLMPLMTGALIASALAGRKKTAAFFALALASAGVAMIQNCSRQTLLASPLLSIFMLWVYRRDFRRRRAFMAFILASFVLTTLLAVEGTSAGRRFTAMMEPAQISGGGSAAAVPAERENNSGALFRQESEITRLTLWREGWEIFLKNPVLGVGPANLPDLPPYGPMNHAHQVFITVLAETGLVGLAGFLALHLAPLSLIWPHRRSPDPGTFFWVWAAVAVSLQFFLNGLTDHVLSIRMMVHIHWFVIAAALWRVGRARENSAG